MEREKRSRLETISFVEKKYNKNSKKDFISALHNKKIKSFCYEFPFWGNWVEIIFEDETVLQVETFIRITKKDKVIFSVLDFWEDETKGSHAIDIEDNVIGLTVDKIVMNRYGDSVLFLSDGKKIEIINSSCICNEELLDVHKETGDIVDSCALEVNDGALVVSKIKLREEVENG